LAQKAAAMQKFSDSWFGHGKAHVNGMKATKSSKSSKKSVHKKFAAMQNFEDSWFSKSNERGSHLKAAKSLVAIAKTDSDARTWTPPASKFAASMAATKTQTLATKPMTMKQKWLVKERELVETPSGKMSKRVKRVGFADIEAARKKRAITNKEKKEYNQITASVSDEEKRMYDGDQHNRAAKTVKSNENSFWNDQEANKLAHTSVYTATAQTATKDTQGYRTTPAMRDPYQYIRSGNYARILSNEALGGAPAHPSLPH